MSIKTVLFDLDGTLLPMDQEVFAKGYLKLLAETFALCGYDPKQLVGAVWNGIAAMVKNNGERKNEELFWEAFAKVCGDRVYADKPRFDRFYREEFEEVKQYCGYNAMAPATVRELKRLGLRVVLATNPIFPAEATRRRIRWAGLSPEEFELYTTYENTAFCKPNPEYYRDILWRLDLRAEECLMVGNDATEDTAAQEAGISVFLLTDCLINKEKRDLSAYPQGGFEELLAYLKTQNVHK